MSPSLFVFVSTLWMFQNYTICTNTRELEMYFSQFLYIVFFAMEVFALIVFVLILSSPIFLFVQRCSIELLSMQTQFLDNNNHRQTNRQ